MLEEPRRHEPVSITSLLHKLLLSCTVYSFMALWNSVSVQKLSKKLTTKILCFCKHFWNKSVWILLSHSYFSRFSFRASYQEQDRRNGKSRIMVQQNSSWPLRALLHTILCEWATTVWSTEQFKPHKIYLSTNTRESQGIYGTMFDGDAGIAVYSAYKLAANFDGNGAGQARWHQEPGILSETTK